MSPSLYCLGVDPAKQKATLCLVNSQGKVVIEPFDAPANREGFDLASERLAAVLTTGDQLQIGVESTASLDDNWLAYFHALQAHGCEVSVLRLDPGQVKAFSGHKPLRAKTDKADARRIANFVRQYGAELHPFEHNPQYDTMLIVLSEREAIVAELTRLKNRLRDRLIPSFPELPGLIGKPYSPRALALLEQMPTANALARHQTATIARIKGPEKGSHQIGEELAAKLKQAAKTSVASQSGPLFEAVIRRLVRSILFLTEQLKECNTTVDEFVAAGEAESGAGRPDAPVHASGEEPRGEGSKAPGPSTAPPDGSAPPKVPPPTPSIERQCALLATLPGVGNVVAATVVLRCRGITRFRNAKALCAQLATHPSRSQTGTTKDSAVLGRRGDRRGRPSLFLACLSATREEKAFAFYKWLHETAGQTPKQAICSVMNRMARLMWTLVRDNAPYDQAKMIANIEKHHPTQWKKFSTVWDQKHAARRENHEAKKAKADA